MKSDGCKELTTFPARKMLLQLLNGFFFTRLNLTRIHVKDDPCISMTEMSKDEAIAFSLKYNIAKRGGLEYGDYYDQRKRVEDWLRTNAQKAGVITKKAWPIYFWLTKQSEESLSTPERKIISIAANKINLAVCSFTFDDSFYSHGASDTLRHPCHKKVLNAQGVHAAIDEHGFLLDLRATPARYIEAQVWTSGEEISGWLQNNLNRNPSLT